MGYNIELSVMLKETKIGEIEKIICDTENFYNCNSVYVIK